MIRRVGLVLGCLALALAGCSKTPEPAEQASQPETTATAPADVGARAWIVTLTGVGPVHVGMTVDEAEQALGTPFADPDSAAPCHFVAPAGTTGFRLMVVDGRVARVDLDTPVIATAEGARVGDTEERIASLYPGRVETTPHKYTDGHYLTVVSSDSTHAIVFETDGAKVLNYRSGRLPEVKWVEGCS